MLTSSLVGRRSSAKGSGQIVNKNAFALRGRKNEVGGGGSGKGDGVTDWICVKHLASTTV
jgi:hypothetical protein